jgi:hypothetical protein
MSAKVYPSMVDAKQSETQSLSWFRPGGPYVQQWCARGTVLLSTGVPVVGRLQARRERKRGFQVPGEVAEDIVGELESKCATCCVLTWASRPVLSRVPCGGGVRLPFIGQGESESHVCRAI